MVSNLPSALDNLASNGIINFDADAYIHGKPARYVGEPKAYLPFDQPLNVYTGPNSKLHGQPAHDAFISKGAEGEGDMDWKKKATIVLLAGLAAIGVFKYRNKIASFASKKPAAAPAPTAPIPPATSAATKKSIFKTIGDKLKAMPKWAKIAAGAVAGVIVLFETAKTIMINRAKKAQAAPQESQGPEFPAGHQPQSQEAQPPIEQTPQTH